MGFHRSHGAFLACLLALGVTVSVICGASFEEPHTGKGSSESLSATQRNVSLSTLTPDDLKELVIQFERSTCYGNCPSYKLSIYGDGRVEYEGLEFVKQEGRKNGRVSPADLERLVSEFERAHFFAIDQFTEKGCTCTICTDMPTVETELRVKGISHRVEHYYGCRCAPKSLWDLEAAIDKIIRTEQWTGDVSKQGPRGTTCFNR